MQVFKFLIILTEILCIQINFLDACFYNSTFRIQFLEFFNNSINIHEKEVRKIIFKIKENCLPTGNYKLSIDSNNNDIAEVTRSGWYFVSNDQKDEDNFSMTLKGNQIGRTALQWSLWLEEDKLILHGSYPIVVNKSQLDHLLSTLLTIFISILVMINNINMGCQLNIEAIKEVMRRPVPPFIGFLSQFLFMPVGSYIFGLIFFPENFFWRLGLLTLGCSPGGTGSNFWTLLFNGDVDLSVTMTFFSTIAALGMMPLWMYTLGHNLIKSVNFRIPFLNLVLSLVALTIPLLIGVAIQKHKPNWAQTSKKIIKQFTIIVLIIIVVSGLYVNWFLFKMFTWNIIAAGMSVAWGGYIFGAIAAFCARLTKPEIIAVSIETALQNPGIAFILLQLSLPQPDSDIAAVPLVGQLIMTGPPLWIIYLIYTIVRRRKNYKAKIKQQERDKDHEMAKEMLASV